MESATTSGILLLFQQSLWVSLLTSLPVLIVAVVVGILVSLLQTLFQLQDQALPFAVKLITIGMVLSMTGRWIAQQIVYLAQQAFNAIPAY